MGKMEKMFRVLKRHLKDG